MINPILITASTLIVGLLAYGLYKRKNRWVHVPVMLTAFLLDVCLVVFIEASRQAVEHVVATVQKPSVDDSLLLFHVAVSLCVVVMYVLLTISGYKVLKGADAAKQLALHKKLAYVFIIGRLLNYITSFWVG